MNKFLSTVLTAVLCLSISTVFANDPAKDYIQIQWGVNVVNLKDMKVDDPGDSMSMYTKKMRQCASMKQIP